MLFEVVERRLLFQPRPVCEAVPTDLGMEYDESWAKTANGQWLHCWYMPGERDAELTWLWFGGAGGNLSRRVGEFNAVRNHTGANIFGFDYRGFGLSEGRASVANTAVDARAALAHLQQHYGVGLDRTLYLGISLGAAVAVRLAAESSPPRGMALVAPFASLRDMGRIFHPVITLGGLLVGNKFDSSARVARIGCPLLILHGAADTIVPVSQGRKLFHAAVEPKEYAEIPDADHMDLGDKGNFWHALCEWFARAP